MQKETSSPGPRAAGVACSSSSSSGGSWGLPDGGTRVLFVSSMMHMSGMLQWGDKQVGGEECYPKTLKTEVFYFGWRHAFWSDGLLILLT